MKAAREGSYRSRAAFKLVQIASSVKLFKNCRLVLDLGAAPGGWSQVAIESIGRIGGKVVAVDLQGMYFVLSSEALL